MKKTRKNNIFSVLLMTLMLCACSNTPVSTSSSVPTTSETPTVKEANVIILCGQSNAEGNTWNRMLMQKDEALFNKYFEAHSSNTKIKFRCNAMQPTHLNESKTFSSIRLGMGYDFERFGPEIGMNEVFETKTFERDLFIIKYASGGTTLQRDWLSTSSSTETLPVGVLYSRMVDYIHQCLSELEDQNYYPYIKGICWMQGESDGGYYANQYESNELNLMKDLREEFSYYVEEGDNKIKFVSGGISPYWENYSIINQGKKNNALLDEENNYYIDTIQNQLSYDQEPDNGIDYCHYDSLAMVELGKLFANALLSFDVIH